MKQALLKIRLIFVPFLLLAVGVISIYTFLHWLLIVKLELLTVDESIVEYWIPLFLPLVVLPIFLWKRVKLLKFGPKARDPHFGYIFAAMFAIGIPNFIAQGYMMKASGKLTEVNNAHEIEESDLTKYYHIEDGYLDRRFTGVHWFVETAGRRNENMIFHGFFTLPIMAEPADTLRNKFNVWYGIEYRERISNSLDESEKRDLFEKFQNTSIEEYNQQNLYDFEYFDRLGMNPERKGLLEAVKTTNLSDPEIIPVILKPINEAYELRTGKKFGWIFKSFAIGGIIWLIMLLIPPFNESILKKFLSGKPTIERDKKEMKELLQLFIPKDGFFVTPLVMELNFLIFLIMAFSGLGFASFSGSDLLNWGANYRPLVADGQFWRLFTSIFLHGGLLHVLMNLYALFFVGIFLEPIIGSKRFGLFYIITGICASITSIWWHEATVSVGASGAIFGMYGIFLSLLLTKLFPVEFKKALLLSIGIFIVYNIILGFSGGIDNAAHIGGLISGMVCGFVIYPILKENMIQGDGQTSTKGEKS